MLRSRIGDTLIPKRLAAALIFVRCQDSELAWGAMATLAVDMLETSDNTPTLAVGMAPHFLGLTEHYCP
ncbi:MAG: hypothetical protein JW888_13910 [Pirellulales bacterium]|nr:hypothetical protein [Pirellulales bacterium]